MQQNPLPADEAGLGDMQPLPAVTHLEERAVPFVIDSAAFDRLVMELAVFKNYKDIYNSSVRLNGLEMDIYRLTTGSVQLKKPGGAISLVVSGSVRCDDGSSLSDSFSLSLQNPAELLIEHRSERTKVFAEGLLRLEGIPLVAEYYNGPVMFEGSGSHDSGE
ncbi:MAG: hypothetical protein ACLU4N_10615 [Butyricimonas faecihominis]